MPEGDTLFRTAVTLRRWLVGEAVTAARTGVPGLAVARLVGRRIEAVEARGKHLLIRFEDGPVLHTHMRMTGSWHVYRQGDRWRRPERQARLVIEAGDHVAVCFNAPVIELLAPQAERVHPSLGRLGPDVLAEPLDVDGILLRARTRPADTALGELLLDQQVLAGVGNIYRSEALYVCGHNPWTSQSQLADEELVKLVECAASLMRANLPHVVARDVGRHGEGRSVYRRAGRPCRRCGTAVRARALGEQARIAYWCPACQPSG
jgi:endonuclease VIII